MSVLPVGFGASTAASSYSIGHSVRLRGAQYLSRTFGSPTDNKKWTWSGWVKRGAFGTSQTIFSERTDGNNQARLYFDGSTNTLTFYNQNAGSINIYLITSAVFRDPSAHYHVVLYMDAVNSITRIYVNGALQTLSTNTTANVASKINGATEHRIGQHGTSGDFLDGYLSDIYFIDGQALTPSYFGETNADGVWAPKAYSGTYGTNGFHLDFEDSANLGNDIAGTNDWTNNGISTTAGVTYDWMTDTPTNNFATLNPIAEQRGGSTSTISDGALKVVPTSANFTRNTASMALPVTGKYYWEVAYTTVAGFYMFLGIEKEGSSGLYCGYDANSWSYGVGPYFSGANAIRNNGANTAYGTLTMSATGDVAIFAYDADNGKFYCGVNGVWSNSGNPFTQTNPGVTGLTGYKLTPVISLETSGGISAQANFGQRPFSYTPPTGFLALSTANLPAVAITNPREHFDVVTRTGTAATYTKTGLLAQFDFLWIKCRNNARNHSLFDAIRGANNYLFSNSTAIEKNGETPTDQFQNFTADGYVLGAAQQASTSNINNTVDTYVDWLWKAGGAGVSNTDGSITSTVSANTTAGFSIVTYTGTGANATVGHGLGVAPKMVIVKRRGTTGSWPIWHSGLTSAAYVLYLEQTAAQYNSAAPWNSTAPTSSVFSVGTAGDTNGATTLVAYCFAEIPGYSKIGSYTGNGSADGPFVFCGFRPRFIMFKNITNAGHWVMMDSARDTYNAMPDSVIADNAAAEGTSFGAHDFLSNGFKPRSTVVNDTNVSANVYIYAAFAEYPFGGSNCSPSPAR